MAAISAARKAAFSILLAVERGQSHSDDLLREREVNALSAPDRNLATALVLGVLRWQIQLDHEFRTLLSHPDAKLDLEVLIALRLGAFQLLHMNRIPARAVIDESVELTKQSGHRFASGMVNAVLRKLAKTPQVEMARLVLKGHGFSRAKRQVKTEPALQATEDTLQDSTNGQDKISEAAKESLRNGTKRQGTTLVVPEMQSNESGALQAAEKGRLLGDIGGKSPSGAKARIDSAGFMRGLKPPPPSESSFSAACLAPEESSSESLALSQAHPAWMVERWINFYGLEATQAICRHGQSQPVLAVRLANPEVEAELIQAGIVLEPGELLAAARTVVSGDVTATEAFREGRVRLQDEGSQLVAELASMNLDQKVKSVLDACAAPGGKTLILAERNPTARIVAFEASAQRLEQLQKRLAFLGERVECRRADAAALTEDSVFDLALADVPCSGTGTLGRNPEIRHRLRPEELTRQSERQRAILSGALRAVRPGGHVVYSTCSLEPEENEQVVAAVLRAMPNASVVSLGVRIGELLGEGILTDSGAERLRGSLTPEGALRLLPGVFHADGFFIAMIERTAAGAIPKML